MKSLFSISTVVVLLASMFSPVWAGDMDMMQGAACHRMPMQSAPAQHDGKHARMHHCEGMSGEMEMTASDPSDGASIAASHSPCPMNCCVQGAPSGVAMASATYLPLLAAVEAEFHFASIIFANAGFSSHTDRGPPSA